MGGTVVANRPHCGALARGLGMLDGMGDTAEQQDLSDAPVACPVCGQVHERCVFTAGSLYCTRPDCRNLHHRTPLARTAPTGRGITALSK